MLQKALETIRAVGVNLPDPAPGLCTAVVRPYYLTADQNWLCIATQIHGQVVFVLNLFSGKAHENEQCVADWRPGDALDDQLLERLRLFVRVDHEALLAQARALLQGWVDKQAHDRCWYYPDVFRELAALLGVKTTVPGGLPPRPEFEDGCRRYQDEEYNRTV
ncbi:MAG: hypothetical protein E6G97_18155 [Alphaproteobacteria bacterium]|nr:MAG: hypothetical protein E6G97_18155 [Alphaproteobacteria bacterium]